MSTTIIVPINYALIRDGNGELVLHPSIKLCPVITEDNGNVTIEAKYFFTLDNQSFVEVCFGKEDINSPYDEVLIFTGFYSTAESIVKELQAPSKEVEWI